LFNIKISLPTTQPPVNITLFARGASSYPQPVDFIFDLWYTYIRKLLSCFSFRFNPSGRSEVKESKEGRLTFTSKQVYNKHGY